MYFDDHGHPPVFERARTPEGFAEVCVDPEAGTIVWPGGAAGCRTAYVDGSFVTAKEDPEDFDGCWESEGVSLKALDPVLCDFKIDLERLT